MTPRQENTISLNPDKLDRFNNPLPFMKIHLSEEERQAIKDYYKEMQTYFNESGAKLTYDEAFIDDVMNFTDASHHLGGLRYSSHAEKRVIDESFKLTGVDNLHILSTANFPTGGVRKSNLFIGRYGPLFVKQHQS